MKLDVLLTEDLQYIASEIKHLCGPAYCVCHQCQLEFIWNTSHQFYSCLCSICGDGYPCFEISAVNADKPPLSVSQVKDRVKQFEKVGEIDSLHCFMGFIFLHIWCWSMAFWTLLKLWVNNITCYIPAWNPWVRGNQEKRRTNQRITM